VRFVVRMFSCLVCSSWRMVGVQTPRLGLVLIVVTDGGHVIIIVVVVVIKVAN
jgi:hypothetical protein